MHIGIFFSSGRGSFLSCSRLRGTQGARPNTTAQVWALAEVRGTCSGGLKSRKLASTTARHSEHVQISRPMQTHAQVEEMSDGLRMSFRILLTVSHWLPAHLVVVLECSWSCSSARARMLVVVLEWSCSCSSAPRAHARALVLECSRARTCSCFLCRTIRPSHMFRLFAFVPCAAVK